MSFTAPKNRSNPLRIRTTIRAVEDWWFDKSRSVDTNGYMLQLPASEVVGGLGDSLSYGPVRAANARAALRDAPVCNYSDYTFIDIGSGKGRALFVAAEFPFRRVIGVEFATPLHQHALANIQRFNRRHQKSQTIESLNANAVEYEFPSDNLVLYFCNPFGPELMSRVLDNLTQSIERNPRHVIIVLLWPERSQQVSEARFFEPYKLHRRYHIYQAKPPVA